METPYRRKAGWKVLVGICFILLLCFLGTVAFIPSYFSKESGKDKIVAWINQRITGRVALDSLSLSWFSGQKIENFSIYDSAGKKILGIDRLTTTKHLIPLLLKTNNWGKTTIEGFVLTLANQGDGKLNIEEALHSKEKQEPETTKSKNLKYSIPTKGELNLLGGKVEIEGPKGTSIFFNDLNFTVHGSDERKVSLFHLTFKSLQGVTQGEAILTGKFPCCRKFTIDLSDGITNALEKVRSLYLMGKVTSFPVAALDELFTNRDPKIAGIYENALGQTLDIQGELGIAEAGIKENLEITSTNLTAHISGQTKNGFFQIDPDSKLVFTITPTFFEKAIHFINPYSKWHLGEKTKIHLELDKFSIPIPFKKEDASFVLNGSIDEAFVSHEIIGHISLRHISLSASALTLKKEIFLQYAGEIQTPESPSKFEGKIEGKNLINEKGKLSFKDATLNFTTTLSAIPLDALEIALGEKVDLTPYFGRSLTLSCSGKIENGTGEINAKINSTVLQAENIQLIVNNSIALRSPVKIVYRLSPGLIKEFFPYETEVRVIEGGYLNVEVQKFVLPLHKDGTLNWNDIEMDADLAMGSANISGITHFSPLLLRDILGHLNIATLEKASLLLKGVFGFSETKEYVALIVGPNCAFTFSGEGAVPLKKGAPPLTFSTLALKTECDRFLMDIRGKVDENGVFSLTRPSSSTLTITKQAFNDWAKIGNKTPPLLREEAKITTETQYLEFQLFPFIPRTIKGESVLTMPKLIMEEENITGPASISDLKMIWKIDGEKEEIAASIDAKTNVNINGKSESGDIFGSLTFKQFLKGEKFTLSAADFALNLEAIDFPVFILDAFIQKNGNLVTLIGPSINLKFKAVHTPEKEPTTTLSMLAQGDGLSADLNLTMDGTLKVLQDHPGTIKWTMTPARYHSLMFLLKGDSTFPKSDYILLNSTPVTLTISELSCPTEVLHPGGFLCQSGFIGKMEIGPMNLMNQMSRDNLVIQNMQASISGRNFSQAIQLNASSNFESRNPQGAGNGTFRFKGELLNAWTPAGKWNKENLTVQGAVHIDNLPVRSVLSFIPPLEKKEREIFALLGDKLNAKIEGKITNYSGPLNIQIAASNFKAEAPFYLNAGNLTLLDTLKAEITLTQEVSETFLVDIYPLLFEAARSDHPIRLNIEKEGFFLPLRPYSFEAIKIPNAVIDIGEIWVKNGGQLQSLMDFLKAQNITMEGVMSAWFTPIYVSLENGVATYKRFDALLAKSVHIAAWGRINHSNETVNLVLAISPATLQRKLGVSGLKKEEMFQIKMRGKVNNLEVDWSGAYKRVAAIIAKSSGGPGGFIVGGLLDLLNALLGEEPTPPPTTHPFPWKTRRQ